MPSKLKTLVIAFLASAVLTGCEITKVSDPLTTKLGGADPDSRISFMHELADRPLVSNDEAAHALLMFFDESATATTYPDRLAALKAKGLYHPGFDGPADEAVLRGTVAYAICKGLNIRGGVTMHVFGVSNRYAVRELADMELFPLSSPDQTFSGNELVGIIGKAEDYQRGGAGEKMPGSLAGDAQKRQN